MTKSPSRDILVNIKLLKILTRAKNHINRVFGAYSQLWRCVMLYSTQTLTVMRRFGMRRAVEMIADAGFPAIDISIYNSDEDIRFVTDEGYLDFAGELVDFAKSRGIVFNQAHAPFRGHHDMKYLDMIRGILPRCMEFCRALSIPHIIVHPVSPYYIGHEKEVFDINLNLYKSLAPYAKEYGVKIAIENMWLRDEATGRIGDSIYAAPRELADTFDALDDADAFTVCLDIGHATLTAREPEDVIRTLGGDRLGALHVHDNDYVTDLHTLPGVINKINWEEVCRALGEINYKGDITLEADGFLKNLPIELTCDALSFMRSVARNLAERVDSYRAK